MSRKKLCVQMLGDFSVSYEGKALALERNGYTKASQLLQYLLYHHGRPILRDTLTELLYNGSRVASQKNNLKVNIFRLRNLLSSSGLPPGEYITQNHGSYTWENLLEVELDTACFEKQAHEALGSRGSPEMRRVLLLRASQSYTGGFLPMLSFSAWASSLAEKYQDLYVRLVTEARVLLIREGSSDKAVALLRRAIALCPGSEELRIQLISTLLDLCLYREASAAVDAAHQFFRDADREPSSELTALERRLHGGAEQAAEIHAAMEGRSAVPGKGKAVAFCGFSCFTVCSGILGRLASGGGQPLYLLLGTLADKSGAPLGPGTDSGGATEALREAIGRSLPEGGLFTRYSPNQFLIQTGETNRQDAEAAAQRIASHFREDGAARHIHLLLDIVPGHIAAEAGRDGKDASA
jgi:DNA-binding SARP family transcriptional activator